MRYICNLYTLLEFPNGKRISGATKIFSTVRFFYSWFLWISIAFVCCSCNKEHLSPVISTNEETYTRMKPVPGCSWHLLTKYFNIFHHEFPLLWTSWKANYFCLTITTVFKRLLSSCKMMHHLILPSQWRYCFVPLWRRSGNFEKFSDCMTSSFSGLESQ